MAKEKCIMNLNTNEVSKKTYEKWKELWDAEVPFHLFSIKK